jgi:hypothetical protein
MLSPQYNGQRNLNWLYSRALPPVTFSLFNVTIFIMEALRLLECNIDFVANYLFTKRKREIIDLV